MTTQGKIVFWRPWFGPRWSWVGRNLAATAGGVLTGWIGLTQWQLTGTVPVLRLALGWMLAALFWWGPQVWPGVIVGGVLAGGWLNDWDLQWALGWGLGQAAGAWVGYTVLRRVHFDPTLARVRDVLWMLGLAVGLAALASSSLNLLGLAPGSGMSVWQIWSTPWPWFASQAVGTLVVLPFLLVWVFARVEPWQTARAWEAAWLLLPTILLGWVMANEPSGRVLDARPWALLLFPLVLLATFRLGRHGTVSCLLVLTLVAVVRTMTRGQPPTVEGYHAGLWHFWLMLLVVMASALLLAASLAEQRRTTGMFRASRSALQNLMENAVDMIFAQDMGGRLTFVSLALQRQVRRERSELVGQSSLVLAVPEDHVLLEDAWRRFSAGRVVSSVSFALAVNPGPQAAAKKTGRILVDAYCSPIVGPDGTPIGMQAVLRDVTDSRRQQQVMERINQVLAAIIEAAPLAVLTVDLEGRVRQWNPAAESIFGWTRQEVLHRRLPILTTEARPLVREAYRKLIHGQSVAGLEVRCRHKSHRVLEVRYSAAPVYDSAGWITGIMAIMEDFTQRKEMETSLRRSEAHARDLAGRQQVLLRELDHRVKNNLAGLFALVDMYARRSATAQDLAGALRGKLMAMNAAHGLIAAAGWHAVNFSVLLRGLAGPYVTDPRTGGQAFVFQGPDLEISPRQVGPLAMVLQELFTNSQKHGAYRTPQGRVTLTWEWDQDDPRHRRLHLQWRESGGPPIQPPGQPGQGLALIDGFCRFELAGTCRFAFDPTGFVCDIHWVSDVAAPPEQDSPVPA